ncbi:hypothetical protein [Desulfosediminicola flagellatus]|uniref:hypothetical protein n=1 Tax=Desulfosediminicola flagellatus TaxID=2569541 RepID=UPI0010AC93D9|nr:hypothetical protein [Desulfosediminicola flagellatus]
MNPTTQNIDYSKQNEAPEYVTLEQMDVICRKCNQLHDEEILIAFGRVWKKLVGMFIRTEEKQFQKVVK